MKTLFRNALFALLFIPGLAYAQGCIEYTGDDRLILRDGAYYGPVTEVVTYFTLITERDLYNSRGERLLDYRAILQQDRANLHKSGTADSYVEYDNGEPVVISEMSEDYFITAQRRSLLSSARYFQYCYAKSQTGLLEREIERGQVNAALLRVSVFALPDGELAVLIAAVG